jgi:hypothetical protein
MVFANGRHQGLNFCGLRADSIHRVHRTPPRASTVWASVSRLTPASTLLGPPAGLCEQSSRALLASSSSACRTPGPSRRLHWRLSSLLASVMTGDSAPGTPPGRRPLMIEARSGGVSKATAEIIEKHVMLAGHRNGSDPLFLHRRSCGCRN